MRLRRTVRFYESLSGFIAKAPRDDPRSRGARPGCHQTESCNRRTPDSFRALCPPPRRCRADGERNGAVDCLRAIDNFLVAVRAKPFFRFRNDRARIFLARVIRGNDGVIGEAVRHLRHQRRAFADLDRRRNQTRQLIDSGEVPAGFQNVPERIGRVGIVDKHLKLSLRRDQFQPSRNLRRFRKTQHRAPQINS